MGKCPKCDGFSFTSTVSRAGSGYPTKLIVCSKCRTVVGATLVDEIQSMIETVYKKLKSSN